jgi:hypothetical protein
MPSVVSVPLRKPSNERHRWYAGLAITLLILATYCLTSSSTSAQNLQDVTLILKTVKNPAVYNIGEPIRIQLSFSSDAGNYCFSGGSVSRGWMMYPSENFVVAPLDNPSALGEGTQDPHFDDSAFAFIHGGSILQSIPHWLTKVPDVVSIDLNEWIRFMTPGRYVLTVTSDNRIQPSPSCGIWDGREPRAPPAPITVQSNRVELTILPVDRQWELRELDEIRHALDSSGSWFQVPQSQSADSNMICFEGDCRVGGRIGSARRLRYLSTQDATTELARRFLATEAQDSYQAELSQGLLDSPWRDTAIAVLEGALRNPEMRIPPTVPGGAPPMICQLLAEMMVAREFQDRPLPARPPRFDPQMENSRRLASQPWRDRYDIILADLRAIRPGVQ